MNLIYRQTPQRPLTHVYVIFPRSGACLDPATSRGLGRLTLRTLLMGAGDLSAETMSERLERLGAVTGSGLSNDHISLRLTTLTDKLDEALELFRLSLHSPRFDGGEFARVQTELTSAWRSEREESKQLRAQEVFLARCYEDRSHAYLPDGRLEGLRACTAEMAAAHYRRLVAVPAPILAVLSDLPREAVEEKIVPLLFPLPGGNGNQPSSLSGQAAYPWDDFTLPQKHGRTVTLVPEMDTATDEVMLGSFSTHRKVPDWHVHRLISMIFGGDMNSRLFRQIRGERGYSYGASCWYEAAAGRMPRDMPAPFAMYTFPSAEHSAAAVPLVIELYEQLVAEGVTEEELDLARAYLINSYPFRFDTPEKQMGLEIDEALYGITTDDDETHRAKLAAVTPQDILKALRATHHPEQMEIVLLGDPARLEKTAASLHGVEKIHTVRYPDSIPK